MLSVKTGDTEYLCRALRIAAKGIYTTHPNPRVGCVLVKRGRVIGEGYHLRAGEEHAEASSQRCASGHWHEFHRWPPGEARRWRLGNDRL